MPSLYLVHSEKDKEIVMKLAEAMGRLRDDVWIDGISLGPEDSFLEKLSGEHEIDYLLIFISSGSVKTNWFKKEIDKLVRHGIEGRMVRIVPVMLEHEAAPASLVDIIRADFSGAKFADPVFKSEFRKLVEFLGIVKKK